MGDKKGISFVKKKLNFMIPTILTI